MYSKDYLSNLVFGTKEFVKVQEELVHKIVSNRETSLAEEFFVCDNLRVSYDKERNPYPVMDVDGCANSNFVYIYLTHYKDINCYNTIYRLGVPVSVEECAANRLFLQKESISWLSFIESQNRDKTIIYLRQEVKHQIKNVKKYCENAQIGHFHKEFLIKNIILHSKFIYLRVKEFFQELGSDSLFFELFGNTILIDSYFYIHILFRHYAASIKEHQQEKSYHIENFDYRWMPLIMKNIILMYGAYVHPQHFNQRGITFTLNKTFYSLWFKGSSIKVNGVDTPCLRLQTFYPVDSIKEKTRLSSYAEVYADDGIGFLIEQ